MLPIFISVIQKEPVWDAQEDEMLYLRLRDRCIRPFERRVEPARFGHVRAGRATGRGGNIPLDFIKLQIWNILPNGRSTKFYSIGALRQKQADWFREDLTELFNLLAQEKIKPVIAERMPLTEAARAHELIEQAAVNGKIVLVVNE